MLLFTYQSYLWNEGVRRLLQLLLPARAARSRCRTRRARCSSTATRTPETCCAYLREAHLPAARARHRPFERSEGARGGGVGAGQGEAQARATCASTSAARLLYFKHEERADPRHPAEAGARAHRSRDELNRGFVKVNVAFTLPPGQLRDAGGEAAVPLRTDQEDSARGDPRPSAREPPARTRRGDRGASSAASGDSETSEAGGRRPSAGARAAVGARPDAGSRPARPAGPRAAEPAKPSPGPEVGVPGAAQRPKRGEGVTPQARQKRGESRELRSTAAPSRTMPAQSSRAGAMARRARAYG